MDEKKQIILSYLSVIGAAASVLQTFVYIFLVGSIFWSLLCFICALFFLLVYLLNKKQMFDAARILYFSFTGFFICAFGLFLGSGNGMHYYYIPLLSVLFILYNYPQDKGSIVVLSVFILITAILMVVLEGKYNMIDIEPSFMRYVYLSNFFTSLIVSLMAFFHVVSINMNMEKRMNHSDSNLQAVFNSTRETLFVIDPQYNLMEYNRAAAQQVKLYNGLDLVKGEKVFQFVQDPNSYRNHIDKCLAGETLDYIKEVDLLNGQVGYYQVMMTPIKNYHNEIVAVASTGLNVTEKIVAEKELANRKKLLSTTINELPDAIFLTDASTKEILSCNTAAVNLFQVDTEDELKSVKGEVFHKKVPDENFFALIEDSLQLRGVWKSDLEYVAKKGREFWGALYVKRMTVDGKIYDLVRVTDISKKVKEKQDLLAFVEMKKRDIASQQKQKNLSLIINGQEQERQRFSKELHDGIGQMLTAIRLQVSALDIDDLQDYNAQKQKINKTIDTTITEVKRISSNLMPSAIEDFGLLGALEHLCNLVPPSMRVEFYPESQMNEIKLTQKQQFTIYRIAQEAINNAVKHSAATVIRVNFSKSENDELLLQIRDNGKGFKQDKLLAFYENHTIGSGLNNMKERAEIINARFTIQSSVGEGTSINLFIPLHPKTN